MENLWNIKYVLNAERGLNALKKCMCAKAVWFWIPNIIF